MDKKVIFNFQQNIKTTQEEIRLFLPVEEIPKEGYTVSFNYELAQDLAGITCVVSEIRYTYYKGGLDHMVVFLKAVSAERETQNA